MQPVYISKYSGIKNTSSQFMVKMRVIIGLGDTDLKVLLQYFPVTIKVTITAIYYFFFM